MGDGAPKDKRLTYGQFLVKGPAGDFDVMGPHTFAGTYEEVAA